jgi:DnaJ-class molecular chaperone
MHPARPSRSASPDLNANDPDAAVRIEEVVRVNAALSDPEMRAIYDRMLDFGRQQHQQASVGGSCS